MFNTFVLVITKIIQYSINLLFKFGIHIEDFIPFKISFDTVEFKLFENYMVLQATPEFHSEENIQSLLNYLKSKINSPYLLNDLLSMNTELKKIVNKEIIKVLKKYNIEQMLMQSSMHNGYSSLENYKVFEQLIKSHSNSQKE